MTLGRLMELYQAEQQGKQIMKRTECIDDYSFSLEVKIGECELSELLGEEYIEPDYDNDCSYCYNFFIKDEEDKYGNKINKE